MIEINGLTKRYGKKMVLDHISFRVEKGEILGFLGPNGAGKTTTMNILTGYLSSSEGTVTVDGFDILEQPFEVKRRIGYLPEQPPLYFDMTVTEYLDFVFDLKKADGNKAEQIDRILKMVYIDDVKGRLIKNLSKGYKQRVGLAQALIGDPEVLVLDEPTVGLDPKQIIEIRNLIGELGKSHTIILSSHILPEVSAICERVIILNKGKIVATDTPDMLSKKMIGNRYLLRVCGGKEAIEAVLSETGSLSLVEYGGVSEEGTHDFEIVFSDVTEGRIALFYQLAEQKLPMVQLQPLDMSLEEVFLRVTQEDMPETGEISENDKKLQAEETLSAGDDREDAK